MPLTRWHFFLVAFGEGLVIGLSGRKWHAKDRSAVHRLRVTQPATDAGSSASATASSGISDIPPFDSEGRQSIPKNDQVTSD